MIINYDLNNIIVQGAEIKLMLFVLHTLFGPSQMYAVRTRCQCYKTVFGPQFTDFHNKLECLSLASFSSLV